MKRQVAIKRGYHLFLRMYSSAACAVLLRSKACPAYFPIVAAICHPMNRRRLRGTCRRLSPRISPRAAKSPSAGPAKSPVQVRALGKFTQTPYVNPNAFVWTKIQAEAGQSIKRILNRERVLSHRHQTAHSGGGFGQLKIEKVRSLVANKINPEVVFSRMLSAPA